MHHTSIEKRPKYPTLKRSPCDLNNEGPQAKYHKVHDNPLFDQNLKHFENIGVMNIGKINEEEPSDYDTFHSNNGNNNNVEAKEFLNQAISSITEEMNYGFPRKISDALHSGVTYRIIAGYKKTNGNLVNDVIVLRNITNGETATVYSCHILKKLYGGKIENLTPVLLKELSKVHICYVGKIENGSYNFIIKM